MVPFPILLAPGMHLRCPGPLPGAQPRMGHPWQPMGTGICPWRQAVTASRWGPGLGKVAVMLG